jgi:hypothetical protein
LPALPLWPIVVAGIIVIGLILVVPPVIELIGNLPDYRPRPKNPIPNLDTKPKPKPVPSTQPKPEPRPKPDTTGPHIPWLPPCDDDEEPSCEKEYLGLPNCENYTYYSMDDAYSEFTNRYKKGLSKRDAIATDENCKGGTHRNVYLDGEGNLIATIICCPCCDDSDWPVVKESTGCNVNWKK